MGDSGSAAAGGDAAFGGGAFGELCDCCCVCVLRCFGAMLPLLVYKGSKKKTDGRRKPPISPIRTAAERHEHLPKAKAKSKPKLVREREIAHVVRLVLNRQMLSGSNVFHRHNGRHDSVAVIWQ